MNIRYSFCLVAALSLLTFGISGTASAFHAGGVAHCDGCHSMHSSADNPLIGAANTQLLIGSDASSTCLNCHEGSGGYHIMSDDASNTNSGGDFFFLTEDFSINAGWAVNTYLGENRGHNVIAANFGLVVDSNPSNVQAPGGTYPAASLGCQSCHDPHGQIDGGTGNGAEPISISGSYGDTPVAGSIAGNYRLLGDTGYVTGGVTFTNPAPVAQASGSDGASVDYGQGMSEWCANCHGDFLVGVGNTKHASGNGVGLNDGPADLVANYNAYIATGDFNGAVGTSYDPLVSFERQEADGTALDATSTVGPDTNATVMCLTCHRAHASGNSNAGRWDFEVEFLAESHILSPEALVVFPDAVPYYANGAAVDIATDYGEFQRSLCNKCHVKD